MERSIPPTQKEPLKWTLSFTSRAARGCLVPSLGWLTTMPLSILSYQSQYLLGRTIPSIKPTENEAFLVDLRAWEEQLGATVPLEVATAMRVRKIEHKEGKQYGQNSGPSHVLSADCRTTTSDIVEQCVISPAGNSKYWLERIVSN
jgi:hypothetical protein